MTGFSFASCGVILIVIILYKSGIKGQKQLLPGGFTMKEKINQFAKGIFEYTIPEIVLEPQRLEISVDAGESCHGSFVISNAEKRMMKGMVCTDCHYLILEQETFHGEVNEISFTFQGNYLSPGEVLKGNIRVISDCGSELLPYSVTVNAPSCTVSTGRIRDLFHFASLAKENLQEAVRLFRDPRFEKIFLGRDDNALELYRGLNQGPDKGLAMEEFLIAIHKKVPVQLSAEKHSLHYKDCQETFMDRIVLRKDTWGYCEYQVQVDAGFIELEHHRIRTTDFVGSTYELSFVVCPDKMTSGRNFARLMISNARQTIQIEIAAEKSGYQREAVEQRLGEQEIILQLYQSFLLFYQGKMDAKEYSSSVERLICTLDRLSEGKGRYSWLLQVFRIHLAILQRREDTVILGLKQLEERQEELWEQNPLLYGCYYYLLALWCRQTEEKKISIQKLRECYLAREHHWLILWFLLQLDGEYYSIRKRQDAILEQLQEGCHSPLLYLELCKLYNELPDLLLELDSVREQCLHWGCRQDCLSRELQFRYTYLVSRQRNFSKVLLEDFCIIYQRNPSDDVLTMICKMLMRDRRVSAEDLKWYALGIERNLKITDLYEHYMYALEESPDLVLPSKVLLYFSYNNHLSASKKALLYAYVIRHKEEDREIYDAYYQSMKEYTYQQLMEGRIHSALSVLYEEFITEETLDQQLAQKLPAVLFAREITCYNSDIVGVYVRHRELENEEFVPLIQGKAIVSVFTGNAQIFLADAKGNRYVQSIDYTLNRLLHLNFLAQKCLEYAGDNMKLQLYLYEKADSMNQTGDYVVELRKRVMEIPQLSSIYRKKVFSALARYYFENFEGELLDYQLEHMDWHQVEASERNQFIEYCAVRHCFDKAMEGIMKFGYERIDGKRLLQISSESFCSSLEKEDSQMVKLAWYIFKRGKFDENLIRYLCCYFTGSIHDMVQAWRAAAGFGIDVSDFSERILAQIVFTEEMIPEAYEIFYKYYEKGLNKKLIRAFLKMTAYKHLVKGWMVPEEVFEYFYREVRVEENRSCLLAALRHMSQKKMLTGEETVFADYNIHQLYEKNIVLGFYKDFYGKVSLPDRILKEQYVEYIANPESEVKIHYQVVSEGKQAEYITESMKNVFEGIYVKNFILFQDEVLQYYISELTSDGEEKTSETVRLHYEEKVSDEDGGNWYHMLNKMMMEQESGDAPALIHVMQEYIEKKETMKQLMKPLKRERKME